MAEERTAPTRARRRAIWGGWVIFLLLGLGLLGAAVAVGFYARWQARPLRYWGAERARLIVRAPRATLGRLERAAAPDAGLAASPPADPAPPDAAPWAALAVDGQTYRLTDVREVAGAPGFSHLRTALVHDFSYAWNAPAEDANRSEWDYALRFAEGESALVLLLDTRGGWVRAADGGQAASLQPIAAAVRAFVADRRAGPEGHP